MLSALSRGLTHCQSSGVPTNHGLKRHSREPWDQKDWSQDVSHAIEDSCRRHAAAKLRLV